MHIFQLFAFYYDEIGYPEFAKPWKNSPIVSSNGCKYVAIDNVDTLLPQNLIDTINVLSLNIQSIYAKFVIDVWHIQLYTEYTAYMSLLYVSRKHGWTLTMMYLVFTFLAIS